MNLEGAKYTLAVPKYVYDAVLRALPIWQSMRINLKVVFTVWKPGNDGNRLIQSMIDTNASSKDLKRRTKNAKAFHDKCENLKQLHKMRG